MFTLCLLVLASSCRPCIAFLHNFTCLWHCTIWSLVLPYHLSERLRIWGCTYWYVWLWSYVVLSVSQHAELLDHNKLAYRKLEPSRPLWLAVHSRRLVNSLELVRSSPSWSSRCDYATAVSSEMWFRSVQVIVIWVVYNINCLECYYKCRRYSRMWQNVGGCFCMASCSGSLQEHTLVK